MKRIVWDLVDELKLVYFIGIHSSNARRIPRRGTRPNHSDFRKANLRFATLRNQVDSIIKSLILQVCESEIRDLKVALIATIRKILSHPRDLLKPSFNLFPNAAPLLFRDCANCDYSRLTIKPILNFIT